MVYPIIFVGKKISARTALGAVGGGGGHPRAQRQRGWHSELPALVVVEKKNMAASEGHVSEVSQVQSAEVNEGGIQHRRL